MKKELVNTDSTQYIVINRDDYQLIRKGVEEMYKDVSLDFEASISFNPVSTENNIFYDALQDAILKKTRDKIGTAFLRNFLYQHNHDESSKNCRPQGNSYVYFSCSIFNKDSARVKETNLDTLCWFAFGKSFLDWRLEPKQIDSNEKTEERASPASLNSNITNELYKKLMSIDFIKKTLVLRLKPSYHLPKLIQHGEFDLNEEQIRRSLETSKSLRRANDCCGAVVDSQNWDDQPLSIDYVPLVYSQILAIREEKPIYMISGNAFLFSEERKTILLQRRSSSVIAYPNKLHSFGGSFIPPNRDKISDLTGIDQTARREVFEETGISFHIPKNTPIIVLDEFTIHYIQIAFIGINITEAQFYDSQENWEGKIVEISFDDLETRMKNYDDWTPSGWIHTIFWLILNCPNSTTELRFNEKTGRQLADDLLTYLLELKNG